MSIIDRIKRLLGVAGDDRGADADTGGAVTIERERSDADPATETEAAVKGTDAGAAVDDAAAADHSEAETESDRSETDVASTDSDGSDGSVADGTETDDETGDGEADEKSGGETDDEAGENGPSVEEIRGIGPAYADRLAAAGVETVAQLAAADAEQVAETTDLSPKRLRTWIDRASDHETA
jgi:predicted flap endonuclease-1-like 5' DNA nuclease